MRIVSWNIRAGGGSRSRGIVAQLGAWSPQVVVLSEFRGTPASCAIAEGLREGGWSEQLQTIDPATPARNSLLVASRYPLRRCRLRRPPEEPGRFLLAEVAAPRPFWLAAVHIPNEVTRRKWPFMDSLAELAASWRRGPAVLIGDTNSGRPGLDEERPVFRPRYAAWFDALAAAGWRDGFRHLHADRREYTWYSPNGGNGFRIDQALVNRAMCRRLAHVSHTWGVHPDTPRREALSDHAALIVDFADE